MNVLITGGAGFIGSHLVEHHLAKGDKVHVVDDLSTGKRENIVPFLSHPNFHFDEENILTWSNLSVAAAWADRIYHMAAVVGVYRVLEEPVQVMAINIAGCERLLRASLHNHWKPEIVIASSSEVYGNGFGQRGCEPFHEDEPLIIKSNESLRWNYAVSKLADEALGLSYAQKYGSRVVTVRFFNTIGPRQTGQYGMVVPRFVRQAVAGEPITVYGDGAQTRCFCDVRDTVVALDLLAGNPASVGEIVNVGCDQLISIKGLAERVKEKSGSASPIVHVPYEEAYGALFSEIQHRQPSLEKLLRLTDMRFQWNLDSTLEYLIEKEMESRHQGRQMGMVLPLKAGAASR